MVATVSANNESDRLNYLRSLAILDTPLEERFERITRVVCRALNVPVAAISLVDDKRAWFKSIQGLSVTEYPRMDSFCEHAILGDDALVVENALEDSRFASKPMVAGELGVRFYAGQPLRLANGLHVGTLFAMDFKARSLSLEEKEILADMAHVAEAELTAIALSIEQRKLIKELDQDEKEARIDPLTRFWNRKGILNLLHRDWGFAVRHGLPVGAAFVEFPDFQKIRAKHGMIIADEVVRSVSRRLITTLRSYDAVGRWSDSTFLMVLPGCPKTALENVLKRIQSEIGRAVIATPLEHIGVQPIFGATCVVPQWHDTLEQLLQTLDEQLLINHSQQGNAIRIAS